MRPRLAVALLAGLTLLIACRDSGAGGRAPSVSARDSMNAARVAAESARSKAAATPRLVTAIFEDEIERTVRPPARVQGADRVYASLITQATGRGGIQWSASRPLGWGDFRGEPRPAGREGALSEIGQISGSVCAGSQLQFGVIAVFVPTDSWVLPSVAADPRQSAIALSHEQTHFNITEILARELRRTFMTIEHPCAMSASDRDALGAAASNAELDVQTRYDGETNHGLDRVAQERWRSWAVAQLAALAAYATPAGTRED